MTTDKYYYTTGITCLIYKHQMAGLTQGASLQHDQPSGKPFIDMKRHAAVILEICVKQRVLLVSPGRRNGIVTIENKDRQG